MTTTPAPLKATPAGSELDRLSSSGWNPRPSSGWTRTTSKYSTLAGNTATYTVTVPQGASVQQNPFMFVPPELMPDYRPAFASGAMRVDLAGRLWVRTIPTKPLRGPDLQRYLETQYSHTRSVLVDLGLAK